VERSVRVAPAVRRGELARISEHRATEIDALNRRVNPDD
jgi:hypothetical protein